MHSQDAYPQFADMWVPSGYHIEFLHILVYVFFNYSGVFSLPGYAHTDFEISGAAPLLQKKVHTFVAGSNVS